MDICHIWNISLWWWNGGMIKESIHSHIICVMFGVTFFLFCFCHDSVDCLSKILTGQWCIVTIIMVNYIFQHLCIVFISWGSHARLFIRHVKSVQNISSTFEYVKIARHIICNWRFLIFCLILCIVLFVYNTFWFLLLRRKFCDDYNFWFGFVVLRRTFVHDDASWFVLVRGTALR